MAHGPSFHVNGQVLGINRRHWWPLTFRWAAYWPAFSRALILYR